MATAAVALSTPAPGIACKNGISSYELGRSIGVTQKTAWFTLHRVRLALQATDGGKLGSLVEVDETCIRRSHNGLLSRLLAGTP